jgi:4-amino-4-deoxy-L-arabinose transferase-like glycosyltransferase
LLIKTLSNTRAAFFAVCAYTVMPLTIFCGRSFMSDMAAFSFAIWGIWLFLGWIEQGSRYRFFAAVLAMALAILAKAPYTALGLPMVYLAVKKFGLISSLMRADLWLFAFLTLAPATLWYFHAAEITQSYYPNIPFLGHPDWFFVLLPPEQYLSIILEGTIWCVTPGIFLLALTAFLLPGVKACRWFFVWWCAGMALLIVVDGHDYLLHPWYQLPITAAIAALAGSTVDWLLSRTSQKLGKVALVAAVIAGSGLIAYQSYASLRTEYTPFAAPLREAGRAADRLLPRDALLLFATWKDPTAVYYSKRHGWTFHEHSVYPMNGTEAISMLEMRRREGASYFVATSWERYLRDKPYSSFWRYLEEHFNVVASTPEFTIFDIGPAREHKDIVAP